MPVYNSDPSKVVANFEILPKDDYEFIIGSPKAFDKKETDNTTVKNYGVRVSVTVASGPMQGKKGQPVNLYQHNDGSLAFSKQFQMAALGYDKGRNEEIRFDNDYKGKDWSFDTDTGACGDAWNELTGKRIIGTLDIGVNPTTGDPQQVVNGWRKI